MPKLEKIKFEDKIKALEEIINKLENGDVDLDSSISEYTKAMMLIKECDDELKNAEENITKLVNKNGELEKFEIE